ncbi:adducin 2 [Phyllostomus discolor]|uniref:Adducin 2 n=1 Tax=Phyllostomus discolor TaxID=89673 RepID=A0A833ZZH3_9CHIR|nr:adducin 2 [Phyllostomus discolor]
MSEETAPEAEATAQPPEQGQQYLDRFSEDDPEYMRLRNRAADLRQDFNLMEQKKRVTMILQSPSFREELEGLIQEQMKKGNNSSNIWALRQIADFMASTSHAVFPTSSMNFSMMTPINDLHTADSLNLAKGERLMRCKISSVYRLLDLYGWAQLSDTYVTLRVSKEQDHFLISPKGVSCSEVTASSLIKVNILGEVVEKGSSCFPVDTTGFFLHSAIYAARPDVRCIIHLHTPATAAVSAMKWGLLPVSHNALLVGDMAYYDFNGEMEQEADRINLQKCLGPTCKSTESQLMAKGEADTKDESEETVPNPFSQLTDQELEEYKKEVERKKLELEGEKETTAEEPGSPVKSAPASPAQSPVESETKSPVVSPAKSLDEGAKKTETSKATTEPETTQPEGVVVNGREDEQTAEEILSKGLSQMTTNADTDVDTSKDKTESVTSGPMSPEGSPSKSPSKKKKKFRTPSFLKKSKKKEKVES